MDTKPVELTEAQSHAVGWSAGPMLVLAGPGSGKTEVLTRRIARLLDSSRDQYFHVLALTFTTKAAHEMSERVAALVPGLEGRAFIGTFHGFCAQVLRQHGVHLGIKSDFEIYSRKADCQAVLEDALQRGSAEHTDSGDVRLLPMIDYLKARLVSPERAEEYVASMNGSVADEAQRIAHAYRLYEDELRRANGLDFGSLVLEAHRLFAYPAMARLYQTSYRYWLIDEFQDTNGAQYALLRRMAVGGFREVFAVADDDQTIFEWNGARLHRIEDLIKDFGCHVWQLPTNFRCPPRIVAAANRLVVYNAHRLSSKAPAEAAPRPSLAIDRNPIRYCVFPTDTEEVDGIAREIAGLSTQALGQTGVLARNRGLLEDMHAALTERGTPAEILLRRDDFRSPQVRWLVACLKQISRPRDERNIAVLVEAFHRFSGASVDSEEVVTRSETDGVNYLSKWMEMVQSDIVGHAADLVRAVEELSAGGTKLSVALDHVLECFDSNDPDDDLTEDLSAWRRISREIKAAHGFQSLPQFLQELQLRSKDPVPKPGTVRLTTIHGAKGKAFDYVYLMGLAEEVLPSWHALKPGSTGAAIEEERRVCFVAITRTRERLTLSRARQYKSWTKPASRFLAEMGF